MITLPCKNSDFCCFHSLNNFFVSVVFPMPGRPTTRIGLGGYSEVHVCLNKSDAEISSFLAFR